MSEDRGVYRHTVVQISPEHDPRFAALFLVVKRITAWGVDGYAVVPDEEGSSIMALEVPHGMYERIGDAVWAEDVFHDG